MNKILAIVSIALIAVAGLAGCNRDCDDQDDRCSCGCSHNRASIVGCNECVPAPAPMDTAPIKKQPAHSVAAPPEPVQIQRPKPLVVTPPVAAVAHTAPIDLRRWNPFTAEDPSGWKDGRD